MIGSEVGTKAGDTAGAVPAAGAGQQSAMSGIVWHTLLWRFEWTARNLETGDDSGACSHSAGKPGNRSHHGGTQQRRRRIVDDLA